jgi:hypothetical protein
VALLSLVVPGSGQLSMRERERGGWILFSALAQAILIWWSFAHLNVGKTTLGPLTTSWL